MLFSWRSKFGCTLLLLISRVTPTQHTQTFTPEFDWNLLLLATELLEWSSCQLKKCCDQMYPNCRGPRDEYLSLPCRESTWQSSSDRTSLLIQRQGRNKLFWLWQNELHMCRDLSADVLQDSDGCERYKKYLKILPAPLEVRAAPELAADWFWILHLTLQIFVVNIDITTVPPPSS